MKRITILKKLRELVIWGKTLGAPYHALSIWAYLEMNRYITTETLRILNDFANVLPYGSMTSAMDRMDALLTLMKERSVS